MAYYYEHKLYDDYDDIYNELVVEKLDIGVCPNCEDDRNIYHLLKLKDGRICCEDCIESVINEYEISDFTRQEIEMAQDEAMKELHYSERWENE